MKPPIVIIGAGHNGLTAAAYLSKAGRKVTVLETRARVGGLTGGDAFHPGHKSLGILQNSASFRPWIAKELNLERHGLKYASGRERVTGHGDGLDPIYLDSSGISGAVSDSDIAQFSEFNALIERLRGPILKLMDRPPLNPRGSIFPLVGPMLSIRALGAQDMTTLMRVPPMCVADWMRDSFTNERVGALIAHPGLIGNMAGPWSPWTAANLMFALTTAGRPTVGGSPQIVKALKAAAIDYGATIRTGAKVTKVIVSDGRVAGVRLEDGEVLQTPTVLASCDPKTLFQDLVGARYLRTGLSQYIRNIRARGVTAILDLALTAPLKDVGGQPIVCLRTGSSLDGMEQAFDPVKYNQIPRTPLITLRTGPAADGQASTASALIHFVPHTPRHGWSDSARDMLLESVLDVLERAAPGLKESLVGHRLRTPLDLQDEFGLSGGHIFHGEHAPDQLLFMRPTVSCAEYRTPIEGLYLGGSGSHPGGGVTGVPGALGASALMDD